MYLQIIEGQGGHTHSKLYNYSNKNRTHPLAPVAQAMYDYTKGALDISKNPTKASNYLVMLPAIGYAMKAPLKRGEL